MDLLSSLGLPVSDNALIALIAAAAAVLGGFARELIGLVRLKLTRREREAGAEVQEATAIKLRAESVETLMRQNAETQQQNMVMQQRLLDTTEKFMVFAETTNNSQHAEREMYRDRLEKQDAEYRTNIKALEQSLMEAHEETKDTRERVNNLSEIVQRISLENESKDKTIAGLNHTIDSLQTSIRQLQEQARKETASKDKIIAEQAAEISHLKTQVSGLETELARLKAQQNQQPTAIEATVTIMPTESAEPKDAPQPLASESSDPTPAQDSGVAQ